MKRNYLMILGFFISTPFFIALANQWYLRLFSIFFGWVLSMALLEMHEDNKKLKKTNKDLLKKYKK